MDTVHGTFVAENGEHLLPERLLLHIRADGFARYRIVNGASEDEFDVPHRTIVQWKQERGLRSLGSAVVEVLTPMVAEEGNIVILDVGMDVASMLEVSRYVAAQRKLGMKLCFIIRPTDTLGVFDLNVG